MHFCTPEPNELMSGIKKKWIWNIMNLQMVLKLERFFTVRAFKFPQTCTLVMADHMSL